MAVKQMSGWLIVLTVLLALQGCGDSKRAQYIKDCQANGGGTAKQCSLMYLIATKGIDYAAKHPDE